MVIKTVRTYPSRQPKVGDNIVAIYSGWGAYCDKYVEGYEYIITRVGNKYVCAKGDRMPAEKNEVLISDGDYRIFEDKEFEIKERVLKETHVKTFRILGIPIIKRTVDIYEEK